MLNRNTDPHLLPRRMDGQEINAGGNTVGMDPARGQASQHNNFTLVSNSYSPQLLTDLQQQLMRWLQASQMRAGHITDACARLTLSSF